MSCTVNTFLCFSSLFGKWNWTHSAVFPPSAENTPAHFSCKLFCWGWVGVFQLSESFTGKDFAPRRFGTGSAPLLLCFPFTKQNISGASWWISAVSYRPFNWDCNLDSTTYAIFSNNLREIIKIKIKKYTFSSSSWVDVTNTSSIFSICPMMEEVFRSFT